MSSPISTSSSNYSASSGFYFGSFSGPSVPSSDVLCSACEEKPGYFLNVRRMFTNRTEQRDCEVCAGTGRDPIPLFEVIAPSTGVRLQ